MASLLFTCPKTQRRASSGIDLDVESLQAAWKSTLKVQCPHCDEEHQISIRKTFVDGALDLVVSIPRSETTLNRRQALLLALRQTFQIRHDRTAGSRRLLQSLGPPDLEALLD